jgi:hypothetical protein
MMEFEIPQPLRVEHEELHAALAKATKGGGEVGEAARAVARLLHLHCVQEETYALLPLGLLPRLVAGRVTPGMASVLPLTDRVKTEQSQMREAHKAIVAALKHLAAVARKEGRLEYVHVAERLLVHVQTEEEVLYPAAILIGEYLKLQLNR